MNLHWGKTLEHKWVMVKNRPMNYTIYNQYNYTEYKLTAHKYYWSEQLANTSSSRSGGAGGGGSNQSALYAENQFLKKSKIMTDLVNPSVRSQSFTTVVVIASIFLFLTMTITAAVVVFCRKRNSVFAFQKSEQEDAADYEMEDIHTDVEYTETEFESETESIRPCRKSLNHHRSHHRGSSSAASSSAASGSGGVGMGGSAGPSGYCGDRGEGAVGDGVGDSDYESSPARRPLVGGSVVESEADESPVRRPAGHVCRCGGSADPRGQYQRMVVTAVLEKPQHSSTSPHKDTPAEPPPPDSLRTHYIQKLDPRLYYPGFDGDPEILAAAAAASGGSKPPIINVTYTDDPPAYDSLDYFQNTNGSSSSANSNSSCSSNGGGATKHIVTVDVENYCHASQQQRFPPLPPPPPLPPLQRHHPEVHVHQHGGGSRAEVTAHYENLPPCPPPRPPRGAGDVSVQTDKSGFLPPSVADSAVVYVELPPKNDQKDKSSSSWPQVEYVDLPPKRDPSSSSLEKQATPTSQYSTSQPNPRSVPTTPTTPLAPPSTPTGGVLGLGLGLVGMSAADEEDEDDYHEAVDRDDGDEADESSSDSSVSSSAATSPIVNMRRHYHPTYHHRPYHSTVRSPTSTSGLPHFYLPPYSQLNNTPPPPPINNNNSTSTINMPSSDAATVTTTTNSNTTQQTQRHQPPPTTVVGPNSPTTTSSAGVPTRPIAP